MRLETIPLVESEDENLLSDDQGEKHKYLLFKAPTGMSWKIIRVSLHFFRSLFVSISHTLILIFLVLSFYLSIFSIFFIYSILISPPLSAILLFLSLCCSSLLSLYRSSLPLSLLFFSPFSPSLPFSSPPLLLLNSFHSR